MLAKESMNMIKNTVGHNVHDMFLTVVGAVITSVLSVAGSFVTVTNSTE